MVPLKRFENSSTLLNTQKMRVLCLREQGVCVCKSEHVQRIKIALMVALITTHAALVRRGKEILECSVKSGKIWFAMHNQQQQQQRHRRSKNGKHFMKSIPENDTGAAKSQHTLLHFLG